METFCASLALCEGIHRWPVGSPHKDQWRGAFIFSLIYAWTYGWTNNRDADDLRRHRAHYDGIVMISLSSDQDRFYFKHFIDWIDWFLLKKINIFPGLILGLGPANEWRRYFVTTSIIGWAQPRTSPVFQSIAAHTCSMVFYLTQCSLVTPYGYIYGSILAQICINPLSYLWVIRSPQKIDERHANSSYFHCHRYWTAGRFLPRKYFWNVY